MTSSFLYAFKNNLSISAFIIALGLSACGGGSGGTTGPTITPPPPPPPPPTRMAENLVFVGSETSNETPQFVYTGKDNASGETNISRNVGSDFRVTDLSLSPDGIWVAYIERNSTGSGVLYTAPADGGAPTLVLEGQAGAGITAYDWDPDSQRLAVSGIIDRTAGCLFCEQVFLVNRDGSSAQRISTENRNQFSVSNPQFSPNGRYIIQEVSRGGTSVSSVPNSLSFVDTNATSLSSTELTAANILVRNIRWSPNSTSLCFNMNNGSGSNIRISDVSRPAPNTFIVDTIGDFRSECRWSPDGNTVAYIEDPANASEIRTRDFNPGSGALSSLTTVKTITPTSGNNPPQIVDYNFINGSNDKVIYLSNDGRLSNVRGLDVIDMPSGNITTLNRPLSDFSDVLSFKVSPDGQNVAYEADLFVNADSRLIVTNLAGTQDVEISEFLTMEEIKSFEWSSDSTRIAYSAGPVGQSPTGVYVSPAYGTSNIKINTDAVRRILDIDYGRED